MRPDDQTATPPVSFATVMALEPHGPDTFVGIGPLYPWGGLYGGQIVAQALRAAWSTVDDGLRVHSLHAYFIRRGDHTEPIRFEVDRTRNGRSFATRSVVARQSTGAILSMSASFQVVEDAVDVQVMAVPELRASPDDLPSEGWSHFFDRRWPPGLTVADEGDTALWLRMTEDVPDDPVLQACALAYLSDDLPTEAIISMHPQRAAMVGADNVYSGFMSASLDHAVWFHRPAPVNDWQLHRFSMRSIQGARGLAVGEVFTSAGLHVATIAQEVVIRTK